MEIKRFTLGELRVNCYIVYQNHQAFIVDPGYESQSIIDFINENNLKVNFIYITHGHPDHIGGINFLNQHYHVPVYAPKKDRWWIDTYGKENGINATITHWISEPYVLSFDHLDFEVYDTPGHSEGGTILYHALSPIVFAGDTLFYETVGRTDIPFANQQDLIQSIQKMYELLPDETIVYPGHGKPTTIGHEKAHNPFVNKKR